MCKFCTAKFYYLQFDFRKKISINHQSKTSSILIPILTYSSGASFYLSLINSTKLELYLNILLI